MRAFYNRKSRSIWIKDANDNTVLTTSAPAGERIGVAAGSVLTEQGLMRTSDWMLLHDGSPVRYADVSPLPRTLDSL